LKQCSSVQIVAGFATVEGFNAVFPELKANLTKLDLLVVGAGTYRAFELFDQLLASGFPAGRLRVHLGHTRQTGPGAKYRFYRYHPMLHSKVYLFRMPDGTASLFIGSHNLTGFALYGLNGEAGVLLEGLETSPQIQAALAHIDESFNQATPYSPSMKEAFGWWAVQFAEGFAAKVNDAPREGEAKPTIVLLTVASVDDLPKRDDVLYFEIPSAIGQLESLRAEVHIYIFDSLPASPADALAQLSHAKATLWCQMLGLEKEQGGLEMRADWYVSSPRKPSLQRTRRPFRPRPAPDMQQVRVKIYNSIFERFEYLFHSTKTKWKPKFASDTDLHMDSASAEATARSPTRSMVRIPSIEAERVRALKLVPPEENDWNLVVGLEPTEEEGSVAYRTALKEMSPEGKGLILFARRRRNLDKE
jgi:hypothetical protein